MKKLSDGRNLTRESLGPSGVFPKLKRLDFFWQEEKNIWEEKCVHDLTAERDKEEKKSS